MQQRFDPQRFRQALGAFTTGVTVITAIDASGKDIGITANSFNSVSLNPPLILWSLSRTASCYDGFMSANHFVVHVLASDQDSLALQFAQKGTDRFAGLAPQRNVAGVALLDGCVARFECRTAHHYEGGDHIIIVGEVQKFEQAPLEPLLYKRGRFALAVDKTPTTT